MNVHTAHDPWKFLLNERKRVSKRERESEGGTVDGTSQVETRISMQIGDVPKIIKALRNLFEYFQ